jgi:hypothetical protein
MTRARALWRRVSRDWPRWAQVGGLFLGSWQIIEWKVGGGEPNIGVMSFAGALLLFQRAASARHRLAAAEEEEGGR